MNNCDHIIGLQTPRFGNHKFIHYSDKDKSWRGTVCWYCPNCGKRLWEWADKKGYRIKELIKEKP